MRVRHHGLGSVFASHISLDGCSTCILKLLTWLKKFDQKLQPNQILHIKKWIGLNRSGVTILLEAKLRCLLSNFHIIPCMKKDANSQSKEKKPMKYVSTGWPKQNTLQFEHCSSHFHFCSQTSQKYQNIPRGQLTDATLAPTPLASA